MFSIFFVIFFSFILPFIFGVVPFKKFDLFIMNEILKTEYTEKLSIVLWPFIFSGSLSLISIIFPIVILPLYFIWMYFASIVGWINGKIILFMIFFFVFFPLGFVLRLFFPKNKFSFKNKRNQLSYRSISQYGDNTHLQSNDFKSRINKPF
tara:strand:+ start:79 stop:531 length:453 start_codon:yes stop_codon:yes gene_type:complete